MTDISYEDFKKIDMRIVKVIKAEQIPNKTKILKLIIDVGSGETRTLIAGGAEYYSSEYFTGKKFVALLNLTPRKIAGVDSQGMLLAADTGCKPLWLITDGDAPVGAKIT